MVNVSNSDSGDGDVILFRVFGKSPVKNYPVNVLRSIFILLLSF